MISRLVGDVKNEAKTIYEKNDNYEKLLNMMGNRAFRSAKNVTAVIGALTLGCGVVSQLFKVDPKLVKTLYAVGVVSVAGAVNYLYMEKKCE